MVPVYERPVYVKNPVSEGHPARFTRDRNESKYHLAGYEPNSEVRNLGSERIVSLRVKAAKSPPGVRYSDPKVPRTCLTAPASVRQVL